MAKISRNIKKFRTANNITQDELAKQLFVTRQTISGWENGRTQPDIDTLCRLSEIFGVSVEDIIYGEKRFATTEEQESKSKRTLMILFSIIASVFLGAGLILIFVTYWENFPLSVKTAFSFVPMLSGQAAALFTFIKHKDSIAWREGASVLWCAGMTATVGLIDSEIGLFHDITFLVYALMFLPVVYIFDVVAPLAVYYGFNMYFLLINPFDLSEYECTIYILIFFAAGLTYVLKNRRKTDDARHIYTVWVSVVAGFIYLLLITFGFDLSNTMIFAVLTAFFTCIYIADKQNSWVMPFKTAGIFGMTVMSLIAVFLDNPDAIEFNMSRYDSKDQITFSVAAIICVLSVIIISVIRREFFKKNILNSIFCFASFALLASELVCGVFYPDKNHPLVYLVTLVSAFVMAISLVANGAMTNKFIPLNIGLISTAILITYLISGIAGMDMFTAGIMLVAFGAVLFTVNYLLSKKIKNIKKEENYNA